MLAAIPLAQPGLRIWIAVLRRHSKQQKRHTNYRVSHFLALPAIAGNHVVTINTRFVDSGSSATEQLTQTAEHALTQTLRSGLSCVGHPSHTAISLQIAPSSQSPSTLQATPLSQRFAHKPPHSMSDSSPLTTPSAQRSKLAAVRNSARN